VTSGHILVALTSAIICLQTTLVILQVVAIRRGPAARK
jgi:hypothetical protein